MVTKYFINLILGLFLVIFSSGCYYDNEEELYQNRRDTASCDTAAVTFQQDIGPLISNNCAFSGCHGGNSPSAGLNLESFDQLQGIARNGQLTGRITGSSGPLMPRGGPPLENCAIDKIRNWVDQGAPQN